jgi:DNA-binding MarR family transcriptional regulator
LTNQLSSELPHERAGEQAHEPPAPSAPRECERVDHAVASWVRLLRGHAALRRLVSAQLQANHGLTVSEYEALLLLQEADGHKLRGVDLVAGLALTPSGVTRLLDRLRKLGLVDRATCEGDARVVYAVLLDAGHTRVRQAACGHVAAIRAVFAERYTDTELGQLAELLGRLPGASGGVCPAEATASIAGTAAAPPLACPD